MFIFNRSLSAVLAALAVAVLIVCLDRMLESSSPAPDANIANITAEACAAPGACGMVRAGS